LNARACLWLLAALALFVHDASATSREVKKRISIVEKQLEQVGKTHTLLRLTEANGPSDWRGRTKLEDIGQWAYTPELQPRVESLLSEARAADDDAAALAALDAAEKQIDTAKQQALAIASYWNQKSAVKWREIWKQFAVANRIPVEPYDPQILAAELTEKRYLDSGDFSGAAGAAVQVEDKLKAAMDAATNQIAKSRSLSDLSFIPRTTPCPTPDAPAARAGLTRAADPNDYYPPGARRRDEQGSIVVRAHVTAAGCASEFAVVASSGFSELDQAAVRVAEASRYAAASDNGAALDGYVTFKVRFVIKDY
jgi:TonB family protein